MSIEARTAFDRLLEEGEPQPATVPSIPVDTEDARIVRQNREAVAAWGSL
jgi:hypothetical protein